MEISAGLIFYIFINKALIIDCCYANNNKITNGEDEVEYELSEKDFEADERETYLNLISAVKFVQHN